MFIEIPRSSATKVTLYVGKWSFRVRLFVRGWLAFVLNLYDTYDCPLIVWSWNLRNGFRSLGASRTHTWGKALNVSFQKPLLVILWNKLWHLLNTIRWQVRKLFGSLDEWEIGG